jgi:AraC-like DNA-binding protein
MLEPNASLARATAARPLLESLEMQEHLRNRSVVTDSCSSNDPFSDILRLTEAISVVSGGFAAGGAWALRFPPPGRLKFSAIARGSCWLRIDGQKRGVLLEQGDVILMPGRHGFVLANKLSTPPRDAYRVFAGKLGSLAEVGDGARAECVAISGMVSLHPSSASLVMDVLPELVHVRGVSPEAAPLRWIIEQILQERGLTRPGGSVASGLLAQLLFVQALRAHLESARTLPSGWLRAISDERITPALRLMHGDPRRAWTLGELAKASAMSRTSFAVHFKAIAGVAPLTYLTEWRMRLAQRVLRDEDTSVAQIAASVGYTSESAFSNAFKRVTGSAPRNYRTSASRASATDAEEVALAADSRAAASGRGAIGRRIAYTAVQKQRP